MVSVMLGNLEMKCYTMEMGARGCCGEGSQHPVLSLGVVWGGDLRSLRLLQWGRGAG